MFSLWRQRKSSERSVDPPNWKWRLFGLFRRFVGRVIALYLLLLIVGLIPVNNDFRSASDGIEIFISSNGVHADVVVPVRTDLVDWHDICPDHDFEGNTAAASYVAFGWGDKGFYVETPTWADLKLSTAIKALFSPSPCCLHVVMKDKPKVGSNVKSVMITVEQYARLVQIIQSCYHVDKEGKPILIPDSSYHKYDLFCEAYGNYHCANTCNSWVGWVMRRTGIKTPLLTPMPKSVFLYLPE